MARVLDSVADLRVRYRDSLARQILKLPQEQRKLCSSDMQAFDQTVGHDFLTAPAGNWLDIGVAANDDPFERARKEEENAARQAEREKQQRADVGSVRLHSNVQSNHSQSSATGQAGNGGFTSFGAQKPATSSGFGFNKTAGFGSTAGGSMSSSTGFGGSMTGGFGKSPLGIQTTASGFGSVSTPPAPRGRKKSK